VVWEFEEEIGSPSFEEFLKGEPKLTADSVLVSDTIWLSRTKPAIPYALRGNVTFEVRLRTAKADAHSGLTGGIARNPLGELAAIITECYDATSGRVHVPGFYDDVKPPTAAELKSLAAAGFDQAEFARDHGLLLTRPGTDHKLLSQIVAEPTFEVHGIVGGYTGPGVKTVIPPEATAKLSARLVPGQKPRQVFEHVKRFIESAHPDTQVTFVAGLEPYLENPAGHYTAAASEAVEFGFGLKPVLIREGGSIGTLTSFTRHLHVPVVLMGLSLPEHGYHAPNEYFEWRQARGGIKMFAKYFANIASLKTRV
jgi:acetylornithine deacetylase/succinyl-diaminopimelate desuccinylase-like protein